MHEEKKFIAMFVGLYIDMTMRKPFGDYWERSEWTVELKQGEIASSGVLDWFPKALHLTTTKHDQVRVLALTEFQQDTFLHAEGGHNDETKEEWKHKMIPKSSNFQYWDTIVNMELLSLTFIRSHSDLCVENMKGLDLWFFDLDHYNYARWISVHIGDKENPPKHIIR